MSKQPWDLTSQSSMTGALEWVRKRSGATVILAIRPQDVSFSMNPQLEPLEAVTMLRNELPQLLQALIHDRAAKREKKSDRPSRARPEVNLDAEDPE